MQKIRDWFARGEAEVYDSDPPVVTLVAVLVALAVLAIMGGGW